MIVTREDLAAVRYCHKGSRVVFEQLGLDFLEFMRNGIDAARLEPIQDPMVQRLIAAARVRTGG